MNEKGPVFPGLFHFLMLVVWRATSFFAGQFSVDVVVQVAEILGLETHANF
jgi:hypothetical protein